MTDLVNLDSAFIEGPAVASVTAGEGAMDMKFIDGSAVRIERDVSATSFRVYQCFHPTHRIRHADGWETCKSRDWVLERLAKRAELAMPMFADVRP